MPFPLALATGFVPHHADGWTWLLSRLEEIASGSEINVDPERLLGQRTAEMHLALAAASDESFKPEFATTGDIERNQARTQAALQQAGIIIRERADTLLPARQQEVPATLAALRRVEDDLAGYDAELGLPRIRTHGDLHLGQTLRTDDDWVILDSKASQLAPWRSGGNALRRSRTSPECCAPSRMLVARHRWRCRRPTGRRLNHGCWRGSPLLALRSWRRTVRPRRTPVGRLSPESDDEFARALRAWEMDKALYEIADQARNRPTWLAIPLTALTTA